MSEWQYFDADSENGKRRNNWPIRVVTVFDDKGNVIGSFTTRVNPNAHFRSAAARLFPDTREMARGDCRVWRN